MEERKYQVGASTLFNIVADQQTLAAAESAEVRASVNLAEAKVNFDRAMARTLEVNSITIADAKTGQISKDTLIPGTTASGQLVVDRIRQDTLSPAAATRSSAAGNGQ